MKAIPTSQHEFGFWRHKIEWKSESFRLEPLPHFDEALVWLEESSNRDGFYYPPQISTHHSDPATAESLGEIPRSSRPAGVYHLPTSHRLDIDNPVQFACPDDLLKVLSATRNELFHEALWTGKVPGTCFAIGPACHMHLHKEILNG